jgi:hypothetical protein
LLTTGSRNNREGVGFEQKIMTNAKHILGVVFIVLVGQSTGTAQLPPPLSGPFAAPYASPFYDPLYPPFAGGLAPIDPRFPAFVYTPPRSVVIASQVVAAPDLPPARIELSHRRTDTLHVEVYDRKQRKNVYSGDIPAGQSFELILPRDAGGVVNETYQTYGPYGEVVQRNVTRTLPLSVRYDVIVRLWQIQSIAIDRTGKSPSPIEDINFQGKGLGRFVLPAGPKLVDGQIDVYRNAVAARNQEFVAPLQPPTENDGPTSDPIRSVLEDLRQR